MNFIEFRSRFVSLACFSTDQVFATYPGFYRNNLGRWVNQGYLIHLRQGYYAFPEYREKKNYVLYFANRIYRPSYISLHTALSFYGMIPEAISQITSVTSLKTAAFRNGFGDYSYKTVKDNLMFGYELKEMEGGIRIMFATPEKALIDLLYLYPFYNSEQELTDLRLDESYMVSELNMGRLLEYARRTESKVLLRRIKTLRVAYNL